jgi:hypothetical protein
MTHSTPTHEGTGRMTISRCCPRCALPAHPTPLPVEVCQTGCYALPPTARNRLWARPVADRLVGPAWHTRIPLPPGWTFANTTRRTQGTATQ